MKATNSFFFGLLAMCVPLTEGRAQTAVPSPAAAGGVIAEQTVRGVTVRVVDAYWRRAGFHTRTQGAVAFPKGLFVKFDVQTDKSLGFILSPDAMSPNFEPLEMDMTHHWLLPPDTLFSDRIDPRTDHATLSFREVDPDAGPNDDGHFDCPLDFRNIPVPPQPNVEMPVNIPVTTPHGGTLTLVGVERYTPDKADVSPHPETLFWFRAGGSATVKDLGVRPDRIIGCRDNTGHALTLTDAPTPDFGPWFKNDAAGRLGVGCSAWPAAGAATLHLRINAVEQAASLRKSDKFRAFSIDVPLKGLRGLPPGGVWTPLAHAEEGPLAGDVQSVQRADGAYAVRLWARDTTGPNRWKFADIALLNPDGTAVPLSFGQVTRWPDQYFKPSGAPVQPGETGLVWQVPSDVVEKIGATVGLRVIGQRTLADVRHFQFTRLPVPPPGGTLSMNVASADPNGGSVTARSLAWVKPSFGSPDPNGPPELLVSCDCTPWDKDRETAYHDQTITDDRGRTLGEIGGFQVDDQHYSFRVRPAPDAKFLDVRGEITAICRDGALRTLTFPRVPVGPPPRPVALPPAPGTQ